MNVTRCKSCDESVIWMRTARGKMMPVDVEGVDEGELEFDLDGTPLFNSDNHTSHFSTCPQADDWRH